jgi:hypothetical protein
MSGEKMIEEEEAQLAVELAWERGEYWWIERWRDETGVRVKACPPLPKEKQNENGENL